MKGKLGIYDKVILEPLSGTDLLAITSDSTKFYNENFNLTSTNLIGQGYTSGVRLKNGKYVFTKSNQVYIYDEYLSLTNSFTIPNDSIGTWSIADVSTDRFNNFYIRRTEVATQQVMSTVKKYDDLGNLIISVGDDLNVILISTITCYEVCHTKNGYWFMATKSGGGNSALFIIDSDNNLVDNTSYSIVDRFEGVSAQYKTIDNSVDIAVYFPDDGNGNHIRFYNYNIGSNSLSVVWIGGVNVFLQRGRILVIDGNTYVSTTSLNSYQLYKYDNSGNLVGQTSIGNRSKFLQEYNGSIFATNSDTLGSAGDMLLKYNFSPVQTNSLQLPNDILDLKVLEPRWFEIPPTPITPTLTLYDNNGTVFYTQDGSTYQDSTTPHTSYNGLGYSPTLKRCIATSTVGNSYSDDGGVTFVDTGEGNVSNQTGYIVWNDNTNEFYTIRGVDLYKSSDGISWSLVNNTFNFFGILIYGDGKLWEVSRPTDNELSVRYSTDGGVSWTLPYTWTQIGNRLRNVGWDPINNRVLIGSNYGIYSSDGLSHSHDYTSILNTYDFTYNPNIGYLAAATTSSRVAYSQNGSQWLTNSLPFTYRAHTFEPNSGSNKIILSGFYITDNLLYESTDGINYTSGSFHKNMRVMGSVMAK